jgi:hypothetical protein
MRGNYRSLANQSCEKRHGDQRAGVAEGIKLSIANSVLLKFYRIGTLSETLDALAMDRRAGRTVVISHRSDTSNTDLALGTNAAPNRDRLPLAGRSSMPKTMSLSGSSRGGALRCARQ